MNATRDALAKFDRRDRLRFGKMAGHEADLLSRGERSANCWARSVSAAFLIYPSGRVTEAAS